jgi:guanosine-3',5'-bis(diphosphate) 3'-pyrophosphohydrolase
MSKKLERAILLATKFHDGQYRDGEDGLPYITHPMEVMLNLRHVGGVADVDMLCAAILHDTLEETELTVSKLRKEVGKRVAELVIELTREEPDEATWNSLSVEDLYGLRNKMLLGGIRQMSPQAMTVKLADRLANVIDAKRSRTGDKLKRYLRQTDEILEVIPRETNPGLWDAVAGARK